MNHPRSIYKSDFGPHSWFENNFSSDVEEFCSPDTIDDCLKYISQEFSALGYPSIYADPSSGPHLVNCDIVKFLNVIFEILKDLKEHVESKEELNSRNQRLASDLNILNKKNTQLKERLEQTERKLSSSIEKERQLKIKNEQFQSLLKSEKDESKKLSAQIQQQKVAYQREIKKIETNLTQMKNRLNQVLVDKNPDKKIANISTSHLLQRSSNQRGKWKTESLAKSSTEEMYNSMISNYENRFQMAFKEIEEYRLSLHFIEQQLEAVLSSVGDKLYQNALPCLTAILNGNNFKEELVQKFSAMFTQVQQIIASKVSDNKNLSEEVETLKFEILNLKSNENTNICQKENHPPDESSLSNDGRICKSKEDKTVSEQKEELASTLAQIKEEKSKLEAQKLVLIKSFMKQSSSNSPKCSNSVPSFCVLTTKNGVTSVPAIHQLKECLSYPDSMAKSLSPLWKADLSTSLQSSPSTSVFEDSPSSSFPVFTSPPILNDDLPNWARTVRNTSICEEDSVNLEGFAAEGDVIKTDNISAIQSFEEDNLAKLKAAAEDIESRRINFFAKGK